MSSSEEDGFDMQAWDNAAREAIEAEFGEDAMQEFNEEVALDVGLLEQSIDECVELLKEGMTPVGVYATALNSVSGIQPLRLMQAISAFITHYATEKYIKEMSSGFSEGS